MHKKYKIPDKCYTKVLNWVKHNPKKWDKAYDSGKTKELVKTICKK